MKWTVIGLLALILVGTLSYKVYESLSIKELADIYNKTISIEMQYYQDLEEQYEKADPILTKLWTEDLSHEEYVKLLEDLDTVIKLSLNVEENYISTIEKHKKQIASFKPIVFGKAGNALNKVRDNMLTYYDNEIEVSEGSYNDDKYFQTLHRAMKDQIVFASLSESFTNEKGEFDYSSFYSEIAPFEKYTKNDFQYDNEDWIKKNKPYGYKYLSQVREFFKIYYLIAQDITTNDMESANFKNQKAEQINSELNPDFDKLISEGSEKDKEEMKKTMEITTKKVLAIKDLEQSSKFPFIAQPNWEEDMEICQAYNFKAELYNYVADKYPEATSFSDLVKELSIISPKTTEMDERFDTSKVSYSKQGDKLEFKCLSNDGQKSYTFHSGITD